MRAYPMSPLQGQMMDQPLLISGILDFAARHYGDTEIVLSRVEGTCTATLTETIHALHRLANALRALGTGMGECITTLCWTSYSHLALYYGVSGSRAILCCAVICRGHDQQPEGLPVLAVLFRAARLRLSGAGGNGS